MRTLHIPSVDCWEVVGGGWECVVVTGAASDTVDCCWLPAVQYTHAFSVSSEQRLQNYNGDLNYIGTGLVW